VIMARVYTDGVYPPYFEPSHSPILTSGRFWQTSGQVVDKSASKSGQGKAIYPNPYPRYLRRCGWRRDDNFGGGPVSVILSAWVALMAGQPQTVSVSSRQRKRKDGPWCSG
jgi:hypothetical protein